jgi:hypothetical protein
MDKKLKSILAAMAKLTGLTKAEIEAKLDLADTTTQEAFDKAVDEVLETHSKTVAKKTLNDFNDGHKAAKVEVLSELETQIREKFPEADKSKKGLALIEKLVADTKAKDADPAKIDDEAVKKHPAYLQLERDSQKAISDAKAEGETKVKELQDGLTRKANFEKLKVVALAEFDKLNPILPENQEAANKRRNTFIKELEAGVKYEVADNGEFVLLNDKGTRLEDEHGHAVKIASRVKAIADDLGFEYKAANERTSTGKENPAERKETKSGGQGGEKKFTGELPKTQEQYMAILTDEKLDTEAKTEVQAYWSEQNK